MSERTFKTLQVKHRRMEAEFIRGLRISMFRIDDLPPVAEELEKFKKIVWYVVFGAFILIAGCSSTANADPCKIIMQSMESSTRKEDKEMYARMAVNCLVSQSQAQIDRKLITEIDDDRAIKAIIGEAENQGYEGMKAVACVIRTRGSLKGIYGFNAPRVKAHKYSDDTEAKALVAWETSADPLECRFVNGATMWENISAFGKPSWYNDVVEVYRYKDHVFFKEKRHVKK